MMEHIVTFLPGQMPGEDRFGIEAAGITWPDSRYHIERRRSNIYCLEYVIRGTGRIELDGRQYRPGAGDVYLLATGKNHSYRSDPADPWEKIWMNVYGSLADALVDGYGLRDVVLFPDRPLYPLFSEFVRVCEKEERGSMELAGRTILLFHEILLKLAEGEMARKRKEEEQTPAARLKAYIDGHIYENLSTGRMAEEVNLSASQMTRVFGRIYGQPPYEYMLARKMETACLLLANTGMSVREVAFRLGFSDEHYFSNVFRKRIGMPPGRYRKAVPVPGSPGETDSGDRGRAQPPDE